MPCVLVAINKLTLVLCVTVKPLRLAGLVAGNGDRRGAYRVLVEKPGERRPLEGPSHRWKDNIKMDLREVGWRSVD
jgi:hypothetical protein